MGVLTFHQQYTISCHEAAVLADNPVKEYSVPYTGMKGTQASIGIICR